MKPRAAGIIWLVILLCLAAVTPVAAGEDLPKYWAHVEKTRDPGFFLGCSLGCAMDWTVTASSHLKSSGKLNYFADNANDGNLKTCWAEGVPGSGRGQWIRFNLKDLPGRKDTATTLWGFHFANGYLKTPQLWKANNRVRRFRVELNRKPLFYVELADSPGYQSVGFPSVNVKAGDELRLVIVRVYRGTRHDDTCITEVLPKGAH